MPLPTAGDVHVDAVLTQISVAFAQSEPSIAERVFRPVDVTKQSDKYFIYDLADWNRIQMEVRAPGTETVGAGWRVSNDTYFADIYGLHKDIDDPTRSNTDSPLDLDRDAVDFLNQQKNMKQDKVWAEAFFTTGVWTGSTTGGDITPGVLWSAANSTPIKDIRTQIRSVKNKTGTRPNILVISGTVWDALQDNSDFLDRIKYTQTGIVNAGLLASLLQLEEVVIAEGMEVTSAEGASTTTTSPVFGKHALLAYRPARPGLKTPAAGYTYRWSGLYGMQAGGRIKKFRMEHLASDRIELEAAYDHKQVSPLMGAFFANCVA